jgi:type IV pilus assembly protein PilB
MSKVSRLYRRRIGEILVNEGIITPEQLDEALGVQKKTKDLLGTILMDMGIISESDIAKIICVQYQLPFICLANYDFDEKLVQLFPREFLHRHKILPFDRLGEMLLIMVTEIPSDSVLAEIPKLTKLNAALYVGYSSELLHHLTSLIPLNKPAEPRSPGAKAGQHEAPAGTRQEKPSREILEQVRARAKPGDDLDDEEARDTDDEGQEEKGEEGAKEGSTLVFDTSKQSFLEELDSTWDSIFQVAQSKDKKGKK